MHRRDEVHLLAIPEAERPSASARMDAKGGRRYIELNAWRKIANPPEVAFREIHVDLFRTEGAESPF